MIPCAIKCVYVIEFEGCVCAVCLCVWMLIRFTNIYFIAIDCLSKIPLDILTTCDKIWTAINSSVNCCCCCWLIAICVCNTYVVRCLWFPSASGSRSLVRRPLFLMPTWNMNFIYSLDRYIEVITQAWNKPSPETLFYRLTLAINVRVYLLLRADISR